MTCAECRYWFRRDVTLYEDGTEIVNRESPEGKGFCEVLSIETPSDFGCNKFDAALVVADRCTRKNGAPWQHFTMIPCPICQGGPRCGGILEKSTEPVCKMDLQDNIRF